MSLVKVYVAGKVSKDSVFRTHYWRDGFCEEIEKLTGLKLKNLDPTKTKANQNRPEEVLSADAYLIKSCDVLIAYLSDDISVGCSQEILIAKYFNKPVIALAPHGGKFNGSSKEYFGKVIHNYKDPFVYTSCDVVCSNLEEVGKALKNLDNIEVRNLDYIKEAAERYGSGAT